jgi:hypothetical protein
MLEIGVEHRPGAAGELGIGWTVEENKQRDA